MTIKNPLILVPLKFGSVGAFLVIAMFLVFHFSSANPLIEMGMFDFFILPIFLFLGIKEYRDTYNNKQLEFWQGMSTGFINYILIATITSLFILLFVGVINPDIMDTYVSSRIEILESGKDNIIEKMDEESYLDSLSEVKAISLIDVTMDNFLKKSLIGMLLTIMISVIMKRKPKADSEN